MRAALTKKKRGSLYSVYSLKKKQTLRQKAILQIEGYYKSYRTFPSPEAGFGYWGKLQTPFWINLRFEGEIQGKIPKRQLTVWVVVYWFSHEVVSDSCGHMDLPDSSVHGILQARTLKWVAISFSRESSQPRDQTQISCTAGRFFTN